MELTTERIHLDAGLPDDDPRAGREDVDRDPLLVLADQDVREAGVRQLAEDVLTNAHVLEQVVGELRLARPPVRLPVVDDSDAKAAGMHLLAHQATASSVCAGAFGFDFLARVVFGFVSEPFFTAGLLLCRRLRGGPAPPR